MILDLVCIISSVAGHAPIIARFAAFPAAFHAAHVIALG